MEKNASSGGLEQTVQGLRLELHLPLVLVGEESYIDSIKSKFKFCVENDLSTKRLNSDHIRQAWNVDMMVSSRSNNPESVEPNDLEEVVLPKGLSVAQGGFLSHLQFVSNFVDEEDNSSFPADSYVPTLLELKTSIRSCSSGISHYQDDENSEEELVQEEDLEIDEHESEEEKDLIAELEEDSLAKKVQKLLPAKYTLGPSDDFVTRFD